MLGPSLENTPNEKKLGYYKKIIKKVNYTVVIF